MNGTVPVNRPARKFSKAARLLKHADFVRVYESGRRQFAPHMTFFFLLREDARGPRIGLTVGRALGGSVERNRIRRRTREAVRANLPLLSEPLDVVINPKRTVLKAEFAALLREVAQGFAAIEKGKGEAKR